MAVEQAVQVGRADHLAGDQTGHRVQRGLGERAGLADSGRVHHTVRRVRGDHRGERVPVGGVAGDDGDAGAQLLQFGGQLGRAGGVRPAAAGEHQVFGSGAGQPAGHGGAERAGATGDQHGAGGGERVVGHRGARVTFQAGRVQTGVPDRELVLPTVRGEHADQPLHGRGVQDRRQVDQAAPRDRPFQGGGPAEAPDRGLRRVVQGVGGRGGDGAAGERPDRDAPGDVGERLGQGDHGGEPVRQAGGGVGRGVGEREQGQHARRVAVLLQSGGDTGPVESGDVEDVETGAVPAQRPDDGFGVDGAGGDDQPGAVQDRCGGGPDGLPPQPVPQGVRGGALAPPRGQRGQQRVQRGVFLVAQPEQAGQAVGVAAFDGLPEGGVGRGGGGGHGVRPVAFVLEGVGGQVHPPRRGAERGPPVDGQPAHVQPAQGGSEGACLVPVAAQCRHRLGAGQHTLAHRGQDTVRAGLDQGAGAGGRDAVGEPDRLPDVPHPVRRVGEQVGLDPPGDVGDQRDRRHGQGEAADDRGELGGHRVHQVRVERVADREPLGPAAGQPGDDRLDGLLVTGQHDRARPVDGGDRHTVGQGDLVLGRLDGDHHTAGRERLHQAAPGGDQGGGVGEGEDPGHVCRRDLADRVADQDVRAYAQGVQQAVDGDLDGEQRRLGPAGLVQGGRVVAPDHVAQPVEVGADLVERRGEHREPVVQAAAHADPLGALPGEQHREPAGAAALPDGHRRVGPVRRQGGQAAQQFVPVADHDGPLLERGTGGGQRQADVGGVLVGQEAAQAGGLVAQRAAGLPGQRPGDRPGLLTLAGRNGRALLDDDVRVGAGDAERGHRGPARTVRRRPVGTGVEQPDRARRPVHVRRRPVAVQAARDAAVAHRHDHLDDPGDTGGGLGVADVRLHRAEQQRTVLGAVLAVGGEQGLRLDRVAEGGAGAVRLDHVHVVGAEPGAGQRGPDDPLLGGPVRGGQAVGRTVLVDRGTAYDSKDLVVVAASVGEPLQNQHADTLGPADAVGGVGERLAAAVR
ncbi:hypothetical protein Aco03nite_052470 [Actinoplanes couchii]|uniref:Uncharacterized protein n=1 Tax=Actinoplanes couchii TaxID=403638 RepID=A0ABQ3XED1_9ACTN|nr:hypothetical protein Aco03nite_052470 [Actinoplanes couchii]